MINQLIETIEADSAVIDLLTRLVDAETASDVTSALNAYDADKAAQG
jgi:hypothetical protein